LEHHPSLQDDLWGQYWLAGAAAGLAYSHKSGLTEESRLAGLIFAAASLKRYFDAFSIPLPTDTEHLNTSGQPGTASPSRIRKHNDNLPAQPTPFLGRTQQVNELKEMILDTGVRLVTLLGPGGAGKTRLSLRVAEELLGHFPQGVFFVPLSDDRDAHQLISRIAQQLDVREGGRPLLTSLKDYLRDKHLLLVLDNLEQLVSAASIVAELLAAAPRLQVISSSRVALQLQGEYEYPVPPLDVPRTRDGMTLEEIEKNESVRFFVERARASSPRFSLTDDNASAVAEISRRLDGLPLALELAAARIKLLPPQALLARLDDRLKLLTGGARDLPARQQTLRNTLEWSYSLLNEQEKLLYARLGVFVGGFSLEAAEAVSNVEGTQDVLEGLASLVNNSLLRQGEIEGEARFTMLETIRSYALERLKERGEMDALQERHALYFGVLVVEQSWKNLSSARALHWLNWLEREYDNIRATLAWSLSTPHGIRLASELVFALEWFWYRRGYVVEGGMWSERILASPYLKPGSLERARTLLASGGMALWQGKQAESSVQNQEALALGHRHEDEFIVTVADMQLAVTYINMGRDHDAVPLLEEARMYFREQNYLFFQAITTIHLGNVELGLGQAEKARTLHEEALGMARIIEEPWLLTFALNNLGEVARVQGRYDLARSYYEQCEAMLRATGDTGDLARFVHTLGYIALHEGEYARAESKFRESLAMFRQLSNRRGMAECMAGLAGLKARQGQAEWGAVMLHAAEALLKSTGGAWWPADRVEVEANRQYIQNALGETELAAAQAKGKAMSLEQALLFASGS
jgi:predicted ATPase